jgi:flavin reductase (DIM6/NTAB) family NADH-FMN oxidoreductase RutF
MENMMQKTVEYSEAVKTKFPEEIAYAIAKGKNGVANPITLGWIMCTSHQPPMLAISVAFQRYSYEIIRHSKCFTIVFPNEEQGKEALFFGTQSGRDMDKIKKFDSSASPATEIDSVILDDAVANFECVLDGQLVTGDHVIFSGKVVASHINTEPKGRLYTVGTGWKMGGVRKK